MKQNLRFLMMTLLCAVFSTAWGENVTTTINAGALTNGVFTQSPYTLTFAKNSGTTEPTYNTNGGDFRLYAKGTLKIETSISGSEMTQIVFNISTQGKKRLAPITASVGTIATQSSGDETVTWTGNASKVTFTVGDNADYGSEGSSKAGQLCFTSVAITATVSASAVAAPTFSLAEGTYNEPKSVELSCATEGATIRYTTDGTDPTITTGTEYTGAITISETTTIKAIAIKGEDVSTVASATYTINIITPVAGYIIDFESEDAAYTDWEFFNIVSKQTGAITAHDGTNYYGTTGGKTGSITTKETIATPHILTCYLSKLTTNTTASSWKIQVSSDKDTWTDVKTTSASSMNKGQWILFTADLSNYTNVYVRLYYDGTTAIRAIDDLSLTTEVAVIPVTIGDTGYATLYYGTENLKVPTGVTAMTYKASVEKIAVSKTYGTGDVIPAGTGVVLEGSKGSYNFIVTTPDGEGDEDSDLYGLDEAGETVAPGSGSYLFYKLSTNSAGEYVGFYFGNTGGAAFQIPAHKAYLAIPGTYTPGGASAFVFDETVGINKVQKEALSAEGIYTLSGIRVNGDNLPKGVYIVNGKKIVIK